MRHLNLKSIVLLAGLAALAVLAGCGGGSDSATTGGETTAPVGKGEATQKSSPAPQRNAAKQKGRQGQEKQKAAKAGRKQVEKEIHELAKSGKPIPADSPVAKKILETLGDNGGSGKKKGKDAVAKSIEKVLSPPQNGGSGSGSGGQGGSGVGVEKILEQLQE